ncbi:MAG: ATP-grasp domain-containing protein, partial [Candidatus Promineifilaceae bacterium]
AAADAIGYPVLIKASAGGGGKGMRVVDVSAEFPDALQAARSEAASAFGDDHIILEKYFTRIHHIEIQILGDEHGNVLHLFERECSIQRRHQKIIEETPSPTIPHQIREQMADAALKLARSVRYSSAGTVEFMYTNDGTFYLLEMNTRLQVEHPITELVTGIDLAKWQIRIAAGQPLNVAQAALQQRGHAIECRVYAEDPANQFLPSIGTIAYCRFPTMPNVRIDAGIATGSEVSTYYDPMLAKVIVWGRDRSEAIERMIAALRQTSILGVTTNLTYLLTILQERQFQAGETTTRYLDEQFDGWDDSAEITPDLLLAIAAYDLLGKRSASATNAATAGPDHIDDPWQTAPAWRNLQ